jgi:hypothetical protein
MTLNPKFTCPHCNQPLPQAHGLLIFPLGRMIARPDLDLCIRFSKNEWELLSLLLRRWEREVSRDVLCDHLYQLCNDADMPLDPIKITHIIICRLRKKLRPLGLTIPLRIPGRSAETRDGYSVRWIKALTPRPAQNDTPSPEMEALMIAARYAVALAGP